MAGGQPAGVPSGGGKPEFAGSGRPDFAAPPSSPGSSSGAAYGSISNSSSNSSSNVNANGSSRGNSNSAGSFPSNSNAGGTALSHAAPNALPTLQVLDQAFSESEISSIREFFTARAHEKKRDSFSTTNEIRRGQKLTDSHLIEVAEPLSAELLAKLPNRPGITYVRVGNDILLLAGPNEVIVDILTDAGG